MAFVAELALPPARSVIMARARAALRCHPIWRRVRYPWRRPAGVSLAATDADQAAAASSWRVRSEAVRRHRAAPRVTQAKTRSRLSALQERSRSRSGLAIPSVSPDYFRR